jgi:hypothetical protein
MVTEDLLHIIDRLFNCFPSLGQASELKVSSGRSIVIQLALKTLFEEL